MSVPTDPPYCLVYPTSYARDMDPDHFNTCNNLAGTHLCHCICHDDPDQCRKYSGSCLILHHGAQYNDRLFPAILKPWNHQEPLTDSSTKEPFPMELVGDFQVADLIFKGCYGDSLLYSDVDLHWLRQRGIHLPTYRGEILASPAPLYRQAREPKVMKQSPPRAVTPNLSMESPKTKCSSSKGGPHHSSGCSSNTSDSTSARKPSSSKEPTSNSQEKSPRARSSHKCGRSPSPSTESIRCKQKDVCSEDSRTLISTLPISSSMFDGLHSPTGSHSNVTELLPPSITSIPLGLASPRQWQTTLAESGQSLALIYTSLNFNIPGYNTVDLSNLTLSVPSIAGSHHVLST